MVEDMRQSTNPQGQLHTTRMDSHHGFSLEVLRARTRVEEDVSEDESLPIMSCWGKIFPGNDNCSEFQPGGIHRPVQIRYWKEVLKAPSWVMMVLQDGYALQFEKQPDQCYEEENNASARLEMSFVREEVRKWERQGIVSFVDRKPAAVSPLTVATKNNPDGSVKRRLCWDGSRFINPLLKTDKVNLAHLQAALEITREGDFQYKYDLSNAFFHIKIKPEDCTYLGAKFQTETGRQQYFIYNFMPFGLSSAVYVITKLMKPLQAFFNQSGVRHTIFIDDGRVVAGSLQKAREGYKLVREVLTSAGWHIAEKKSDRLDQGSRVKEYLGFIVDTEKMAVYLTQDKKKKLLSTSEALTEAAGTYIQVKDLARYVGTIASAEPALGPFTSVMTRRMHSAIAEISETQGWQARVRISQEIADDAREFGRLLDKFDGTAIRTSNTAMSVLSIVGPPSEFIKKQYIDRHNTEAEIKIWCGDASQNAVCAYSVMGSTSFFFKKMLSDEEATKSSGQRELLTVKYTLMSLRGKEQARATHTTVYWLSDSENLVAFLARGSRKPEIQQTVLEILALARKLLITIIPIHLRREDPRIQIADAGSKSFDSDDWSIDKESFENIQGKAGQFTIDLFADEANAQVPRFFSKFFSPKCKGVDAFAQPWDGEHCWACPPVKLIIQTVEKIKTSNCSGCLVVPEWRASHFWPFIHDASGNLVFPFKMETAFTPFIKQNSGARTALRGRPKFKLLALFF